MPDVTKLIEQDHRELEGLFERFRSSQDPQVAQTICEELDVHAAAEEQAVYPAFAEIPALEDLVNEGEDEHGTARQIIGQIKNTTNPEHLAELVGKLEGAVSHHVHEEETEMLPAARGLLDAATLEQLGADFEATKSG